MDPEAHSRWIPYSTPDIAELSWDPASQTHIPFRARLNHVHSNWAQLFSSRPELFIEPQSETEIVLIVNLARASRKRVVVVGSRHTPNELTAVGSNSTWLVGLDDYQNVLRVDEKCGEITVQSGMRLHQLQSELAGYGLTMPTCGTINDQSISGAIATATHGQSLRHGLISDDVTAMTIVLSSGEVAYCSRTVRRDLFLAAQVSLGALGIITSVTYRARPRFNIYCTQTALTHKDALERWAVGNLWAKSEFERVLWYPYCDRALVWRADETMEMPTDEIFSFLGTTFGHHFNQAMLWVATYWPRFTAWAERITWMLEFGMNPGDQRVSVKTASEGLLMNCLYPQYVNEWAIPLAAGEQAMKRLQSWLAGESYEHHEIPFRNDERHRVYAHSPIEIRASKPHPSKSYSLPSTFSTDDEKIEEKQLREDGDDNEMAYLDTHEPSGEATVYINATLFRPYLRDNPGRERYYEAFEWLMREYGGRPHWAKNWTSPSKPDFTAWYGERLRKWLKVRAGVDREGMFLSDWIKKYILPEGDEWMDYGGDEEDDDEEQEKMSLKKKGKAKQRSVMDEEEELEGWESKLLRKKASEGTLYSTDSFELLKNSEMSFMSVGDDSVPPSSPPPYGL